MILKITFGLGPHGICHYLHERKLMHKQILHNM